MKRTTDIPRLGREFVLQAANLSNAEARFLVSDYYRWQEMRKRADMQIRHLGDQPLPGLLKYTADSAAHLETQITRGLQAFAESSAVGRWCLTQIGIGPVITSGCLAHLDIKQAPTAGHFLRFSGLDPTVQWKSREYVRGFIASKREDHRDDWTAFIHICRELNRRPLSVLLTAKMIERVPEPDEIRALLSQRGADAALKAEFHADNMLREALSDDVLPNVYRELCPDLKKFDWPEISRMLSRRPWNAAMKQVCFHAGQCFKRVSGRDDAYYGQLYRIKKDEVVARNERGDYAERAKTFFTKSAEVKAVLKEGRLPAGNLDSQACRYATKIFLSHLHGVMYWDHFNRPPPRPYAIQHLGHGHELKIPNLELFPGLEESYYGRGRAAA